MFPTAIGLDRYEVLRELSSNDSGATYKAVVRGNNKTIALRIILPGNVTHPDTATILQNARNTLALNSPYIVRSCEAYESDGAVSLVTDYAEGAFLAPALGTPQISEWELTDATRQVCSAIDHASSLAVFHMNLHPANVIQEWDGTIKLLDYGVTVNAIRRAEANLALLQALHYLSPEQVRGAGLDCRSNLFSWGAILYEMITGKKAFPGDQATNILESIKTATPPPAHIAKPGVDPRLSSVLAKALSKAPGERFQTGAELLHALEHCRDNKPEPPKFAVPITPVAPVVPVVPVAPHVSAPEAALPPLRTAPVAPIAPPAPAKPAAKPSSSPEPPTRRLTPTPVSEFLIVGSKPAQVKAAPVARPVPMTPDVPARLQKGQRNNSWLKPALICAAAATCVIIASLIGVTWVRGHRINKELQQQVASQPPAVADPIPEPPPPEPSLPEAATASPRNRKGKALPVAFVAPAPVTGSVLLETKPQGAAIEIDGQQAQFATPHTAANLAAGAHTIRLSKPGYETLTRAVQIQAGQTVSLSLPLNELRATVVISSEPSGAAISINGERSGRLTPVTVALLKGKYLIALTKQGYLQSETTLDAVPGKSYKVSPRLAPLGDADAIKDIGRFKKIFGGGSDASMGKVQFRSTPKGARVSVNGKSMKKLTPMELLFPGGNYEVVVTLPGYKPLQKTITVTEKSTLSVDVQLEPEK